ncbi:MAG: hypothetical protein V3R52_07985 [Candidatus Neomarinimicrobiota bacterium]
MEYISYGMNLVDCGKSDVYNIAVKYQNQEEKMIVNPECNSTSDPCRSSRRWSCGRRGEGALARTRPRTSRPRSRNRRSANDLATDNASWRQTAGVDSF